MSFHEHLSHLCFSKVPCKLTKLQKSNKFSACLQGPATAAQCQQQLTQLRRLGATLQERLALVDTSYAAGNCQRLRLQSQV
jgi:hypothetical protein